MHADLEARSDTNDQSPYKTRIPPVIVAPGRAVAPLFVCSGSGVVRHQQPTVSFLWYPTLARYNTAAALPSPYYSSSLQTNMYGCGYSAMDGANSAPLWRES